MGQPAGHPAVVADLGGGVLPAAPALRGLRARVPPRCAGEGGAPAGVPGLAAATGILLCGRWEAAGLPYRSALTEAAGSAATIVGAVLAVFLAMHWPGARDLLDRRITQWLGRRSFSLYLIHGPVLVSLAFLLPAALAPIVVLGLGPWLALVVAAVFYRLVEAPAHRASQAVGRRVAPAARRSTPRVSLMPVEVGRARNGDRA